jgi:hypothetical protein
MCIWCTRRITPGEVYYRESCVFDGQHQSNAWHWDCWFDAREELSAMGEDEFMPGDGYRPEQHPFRSMEA